MVHEVAEKAYVDIDSADLVFTLVAHHRYPAAQGRVASSVPPAGPTNPSTPSRTKHSELVWADPARVPPTPSAIPPP